MKKSSLKIGMYFITLIYGLACIFLFYNQAIQPLYTGGAYYESDLPYHISMIVDDGWYYSFTAYVYQCLYSICNHSMIGIAVFLGGVAMATILATDLLLTRLLELEKNTWYTHASAIALNFMMAFYVPVVGSFRYVSYQSGNIWHNSTYQCMKLFAIVSFLFYMKLLKKYKVGMFRVRDWVIFSLVLAITTGIKPSFLTVFAPIMAILLLVDLYKKVPFKKVFIFGSTVLPSLIIVWWQSVVLFEEGVSNGIIISPWETFALRAEYAKVAVLLSLAFPIIVFIFHMGKLKKEELYRFICGMTVLGFLQALLLVETGRARDGNFVWGYSCAIFFISVYSYKIWLQMLRNFADSKLQKMKILLCASVGGYQIICGIIFFVRLVIGQSYWMKI